MVAVSIMPSLFILCPHEEVHLYLDAGTGSIVLQAVIGALVGGLVALKLFWNQIRAFFGKLLRVDKGRVEED
jgi:hypothetical protein